MKCLAFFIVGDWKWRKLCRDEKDKIGVCRGIVLHGMGHDCRVERCVFWRTGHVGTDSQRKAKCTCVFVAFCCLSRLLGRGPNPNPHFSYSMKYSPVFLSSLTLDKKETDKPKSGGLVVYNDSCSLDSSIMTVGEENLERAVFKLLKTTVFGLHICSHSGKMQATVSNDARM